MFRSRFFWALFLSYGALVLLTSLLLGVLAQHQLKRLLRETFADRLRGQAGLLAAQAPETFFSGDRRAVQAAVREMGRRSESRITLILPDGEVLADSDSDPRRMDNHRLRPEVVGAVESGGAVTVRYSRTVENSHHYAAAAVRRGGELLGVVRVSLPLAAERAQVAEVSGNVALVALGGIFLALALGALVARRITGPLGELRVLAEAMRAGDYGRKVTRLPRNEIGLLGDTLHLLGLELTQKIGKLANEEAQLRAILAGMVEGVIAVDDGDTILYHNRAAARLVGHGIQGLSGKKLWQFTELRELRGVMETVRASGEPVSREITLKLEEGARVINVHGAAFASSVHRGVILVLNDITDLRRLEAVRRDFVANVSHELKTPLTSIKGYVETLMEGAIHDDKHNVRFLEKIDKHVGHLDELVRDLLELGELEAADRTVTLAPNDWNEVLTEVVGRYELELGKRRQICRQEPAPGPVVVMADREGLFRIASNLLSNAIKYTPEGGSVVVRTYERDGYGCFEVVDTGMGIPERELPRIFERFYRVDKARSRDVGGTGLGLAIVKHLVQGMGGEIRVESRVGEGSRFTVKLPGVTA